MTLTGRVRYRPYVHSWSFRPPEVLLVLQVEYINTDSEAHRADTLWRDAMVEDLEDIKALNPCGRFG